MAEIDRNKATACRFLTHYVAQEFDAARACLDDRLICTLPGRGPYAREYTLADDLIAFARGKFTGKVDESSMTFSAITAEDDRVAVEAEGIMRFNDGTLYENSYHFLFYFNDAGKITRLIEHMDSYHVARVFGDPWRLPEQIA